jgi:hypothetical protein
VHIAGGLDDVFGADEQNVVLIELGERLKRHILNRPLGDIGSGIVFWRSHLPKQPASRSLKVLAKSLKPT